LNKTEKQFVSTLTTSEFQFKLHHKPTFSDDFIASWGTLPDKLCC